MAARFAIEDVLKLYTILFHTCGGRLIPRCLYKVTKISAQIQTARKENRHLTPDFKALQEAVRKILDAGMLKFQPGCREIRGKAKKSER